MEGNFAEWTKETPCGSIAGWQITVQARYTSIDFTHMTLTVEFRYVATKSDDSVVLEANTAYGIIDLIRMREGISRDRFYDSIGTVSAP